MLLIFLHSNNTLEYAQIALSARKSMIPYIKGHSNIHVSSLGFLKSNLKSPGHLLH